MKITPYLEKLSASNEFKDFQKKYKDAFMVAGFFVLDLELGQNLSQLDFYVPSKKKIAAFTLDKQVTMQLLDLVNAKKEPEKLDARTKIDLDAIRGLLEDEMKNRNMTEEIKKIIAIVQSIDGKTIWNLNCILSGMGLLNAHVDDESQTILKIEKKSMMDYIQRIPAAQLRQFASPSQTHQEESKENLETQIKKLSELEQAIEKEKSELKKELEKKGAKKEEKIKEQSKK
jgi:chaperonin cofactor prefoldin